MGLRRTLHTKPTINNQPKINQMKTIILSSFLTLLTACGGAQLKNAADFDEEFEKFSTAAFQEHVVSKFNDPEVRKANDLDQAHWAKVAKHIADNNLGSTNGQVNIDTATL
jgi:hypothetical protein